MLICYFFNISLTVRVSCQTISTKIKDVVRLNLESDTGITFTNATDITLNKLFVTKIRTVKFNNNYESLAVAENVTDELNQVQ